ncbi:hypothetical protein FXO37_21675 [Capsicum annuum]|nr:hypothetical protein FXO37_21675 [Capsicum annuum]
MHNVEMMDADKEPAAGEEKLSLPKSDLDDIKSYVKTYFAYYPVHENEKDIPNREGDPPQSLNEQKINAKSDNIVDDAGQSSKAEGNEGEVDSTYTDKVQKENRHNTIAEIDEGIRDERLKESEKDLHNTDEDLSKAITLYVPPSPPAYPTGIIDSVVAAIDTCDLQGNTYSQSYISDSVVAATSQAENIRSMKVTPVERSIYEIIQGLCIPIGISWNLTNEVYVPIHCHRGHADEIKKLAEMLSTYLTISNFFKNKERTDWSLLEAYKEKIDHHPFDVQIVDGIVQQSSSTLNCGLFVAAYAEYLSDRHQIPSLEFDLEKHHTIYASLLWDYGVNKAYTGYVSDNQDLPRPKRTFIPPENTEMIHVEP